MTIKQGCLLGVADGRRCPSMGTTFDIAGRSITATSSIAVYWLVLCNAWGGGGWRDNNWGKGGGGWKGGRNPGKGSSGYWEQNEFVSTEMQGFAAALGVPVRTNSQTMIETMLAERDKKREGDRDHSDRDKEKDRDRDRDKRRRNDDDRRRERDRRRKYESTTESESSKKSTPEKLRKKKKKKDKKRKRSAGREPEESPGGKTKEELSKLKADNEALKIQKNLLQAMAAAASGPNAAPPIPPPSAKATADNKDGTEQKVPEGHMGFLERTPAREFIMSLGGIWSDLPPEATWEDYARHLQSYTKPKLQELLRKNGETPPTNKGDAIKQLVILTRSQVHPEARSSSG